MANWRHPRYLNGIMLGESEAKVLAIHHFYHSEVPSTLECYYRVAATKAVNVSLAMEYNVDVLAIPWFLVENFESLTGSVSGGDTGLALQMDQDSDWDALYRHYAFSVGSDARYYGGWAQGSDGGTDEDQSDVDDREQAGEASTFIPNRSILESYPPQNVISLFRSEPMCRILTAETGGKVVWGDEGKIVIDCSAASGLSPEGAVILVGFRRYEQSGNSSSEYWSVNGRAEHNPVVAQLRSGMYKLIQERIRDGVTASDDWLRTQLFDGDNNINDDTWDSSDTDLAIAGKSRLGISTPYAAVS